MAENSKIEWCDHTFNAWEGCEKVSPGCANCYAERRDKQYHGGAHWGPNSTRKMMSEAYWRQPLKWNRDAGKPCFLCGDVSAPCECGNKKRPRVFCSSLADAFEDRPELIDSRHRLMQMIEATPNLDWLLLTKRPENVGDMVPVKWFGEGFPVNVWIGTTVEDQAMADKRIPELLKIPAKVRFLSCEPLLGPVNLGFLEPCDRPRRSHDDVGCWMALDWVIAGGESGTNARPMHPEWARSLRDQCQAAGVPFFFKQWGQWYPANDARAKVMEKKSVHSQTADNVLTAMVRVKEKVNAGRTLDGREWNEIPQV